MIRFRLNIFVQNAAYTGDVAHFPGHLIRRHLVSVCTFIDNTRFNHLVKMVFIRSILPPNTSTLGIGISLWIWGQHSVQCITPSLSFHTCRVDVVSLGGWLKDWVRAKVKWQHILVITPSPFGTSFMQGAVLSTWHPSPYLKRYFIYVIR